MSSPDAADGGDTARFGTIGVSVAFGAVQALADVSVTARPGQVTAVVGGDGAGKSTLLRCLAGALAPDGGQVISPGVRGIGYLPTGSGIYPDLTVAQNMAFRATAYRVPSQQAADRTANLLERAGLSAAKDRLAGQLSGGMRQKLGVIAAMLHRPDLLILDEPTTGVDPVSRSGLWWLIASAAATGAAVVFATTYLDEAERATEVLALDRGSTLASGSPADIVAAMPGTIWRTGRQPAGDAGRAWRRGGQWRIWVPAPDAANIGAAHDTDGEANGAQRVPADLQDAVTVAALAREQTAGAKEDVTATSIDDTATTAVPAATTLSAGTAETGTTDALAQCSAVSKMFGGFTAVRQVSLGVRPGEIVGLLGANGAGKTTLIRMLLGLLDPSVGEVALFGAPPSRQTRARIGYVPQSLGLYDDLTCAENLSFAAHVFGGTAPALTGDLAGYAGTPVGQLPLGIQRRVAFAQALAHQPDLLILDEPTSGVDPLGAARLWQTIQLAAEAGAGVLVTTHNMEEASECDRLVIMADGAVVATGTAAQIVGAGQVTVVQAPSWGAAFMRLERAGLPVALAGRDLRVPGVPPAEVQQVIGPDARAYPAQATLEERFFELVLAADQQELVRS